MKIRARAVRVQGWQSRVREMADNTVMGVLHETLSIGIVVRDILGGVLFLEKK